MAESEAEIAAITMQKKVASKEAEKQDLEAEVGKALTSAPEETKAGSLTNLVTVRLNPWTTLSWCGY